MFALNWQSLVQFKAGTFWKDNTHDPAAERKKRQYNNSNRAVKAKNARKSRAGRHQKNGLDPTRVDRLLEMKSCHCHLLAVCICAALRAICSGFNAAGQAP